MTCLFDIDSEPDAYVTALLRFTSDWRQLAEDASSGGWGPELPARLHLARRRQPELFALLERSIGQNMDEYVSNIEHLGGTIELLRR